MIKKITLIAIAIVALCIILICGLTFALDYYPYAQDIVKT